MLDQVRGKRQHRSIEHLRNFVRRARRRNKNKNRIKEQKVPVMVDVRVARWRYDARRDGGTSAGGMAKLQIAETKAPSAETTSRRRKKPASAPVGKKKSRRRSKRLVVCTMVASITLAAELCFLSRIYTILLLPHSVIFLAAFYSSFLFSMRKIRSVKTVSKK